MNVVFDGLRVCLYPTMRGWGGFVEETRRGGSLIGFVAAPDLMSVSVRAARLVTLARNRRR